MWDLEEEFFEVKSLRDWKTMEVLLSDGEFSKELCVQNSDIGKNVKHTKKRNHPLWLGGEGDGEGLWNKTREIDLESTWATWRPY